MNEQSLKIASYFPHATEQTKKLIHLLIEEVEQELGQNVLFQLDDEWKKLAERLNSSCKLCCLHDRNHRALIIEFMRQREIQFYKCSYFNRARIESQYLYHIKHLTPIRFIEVIKIVNKLKLVEKHFRIKMEENVTHENHIDEYIRIIMGKCNSSKRIGNTNFDKFKAIVTFEDNIQLIKELGKLLRKSWSTEKSSIKKASSRNEKDDDKGISELLSLSQENQPILQVNQPSSSTEHIRHRVFVDDYYAF